MYLLVPSCTVSHTALYHLVPPCTTLYHLVQVSTCQYIMISCTALYPLAYVLAHTSTYHLVPPCTRGTGFQMPLSPACSLSVIRSPSFSERLGEAAWPGHDTKVYNGKLRATHQAAAGVWPTVRARNPARAHATHRLPVSPASAEAERCRLWTHTHNINTGYMIDRAALTR